MMAHVCEFITVLVNRAEQELHVLMPGYTHLQVREIEEALIWIVLLDDKLSMYLEGTTNPLVALSFVTCLGTSC